MTILTNLFGQVGSLSQAEDPPCSGFHTLLSFSGVATVSPARQLHWAGCPSKRTCEEFPGPPVTAVTPGTCQFSKYRHVPVKRKLSKPIYSREQRYERLCFMACCLGQDTLFITNIAWLFLKSAMKVTANTLLMQIHLYVVCNSIQHTSKQIIKSWQIQAYEWK